MYLLNPNHFRKRDVQNVFYNFCNICFIKKELTDLTTLLSSDVTLIFQDKITKGINNVIADLAFYLSDLDENFTLDEININHDNANSSYISSIIKFDDVELFCTFMMILKKKWNITHLHITQISSKQHLDKNIDIEAIIDEKTYELTKKVEKLELAASLDYLTGLYNRFKFNEILVKEFDSSLFDKHPISVIYVDIDNFKQINDRYGHLFGDNVILTTANIIKSKLDDNMVAARWGGDEFIIMASNYSLNEAIRLSNDIREELEEHENHCYVNITASFGVAEYDQGDTADIFLNKADLALYKAKRKGKNRVES